MPKSSKDKRIPRKYIAQSTLIIGGLAAIAIGLHNPGKVKDIYGSLSNAVANNVERLLSPKEEVEIATIDSKIYRHTQNGPIGITVPIVLAEIRGGVYRAHEMKATKNDAPEKMIKRAHEKYDPSGEIDEDSLLRAVDLFNLLNSSSVDLNKIPKGEVYSIESKIPGVPIIRENKEYKIPVKLSYRTIDEAISSYMMEINPNMFIKR